jgi:hypothetical protein
MNLNLASEILPYNTNYIENTFRNSEINFSMIYKCALLDLWHGNLVTGHGYSSGEHVYEVSLKSLYVEYKIDIEIKVQGHIHYDSEVHTSECIHAYLIKIIITKVRIHHSSFSPGFFYSL